MAPEHAKLAQAAFKSEQFYCVYGLTEAGPTGTLFITTRTCRESWCMW